jgi:hypothetical protein
MRCFMIHDYPERLRSDKSGIVHAARVQYGSTHVTACGRRAYFNKGNKMTDSSLERVNKGENITCKACAKALGLEGNSGSTDLFIIRERATKMYYNSGGSRHTQWVDSPNTASTYRGRKNAERALVDYGKKIVDYDILQVDMVIRETSKPSDLEQDRGERLYIVTMNNGSREYVFDVKSAQEASERIDGLGIDISDIDCICRVRVEAFIYPTTKKIITFEE